MAYDLDQFIADCRSTLARDPGPAGREQVRANLERLLANADFVHEYCGDDTKIDERFQPSDLVHVLD
jgi:hypothetical protein